MKTPYDILRVERGAVKEPREQRFVEVKSWKHIDVVILTEIEKSFGEDIEEKGGNYWLYIVDMRVGSPRVLGYRKPFSTGALEFIREVVRDDRAYYVYRVVREADELW